MKTLLRSLLLLARDLLDPLLHFQEVSILAYHSISDAKIPTAVAPSELRAQLTMLRAHGYVFVSLDAIENWYAGKGTLPRKSVALTFDDGYADFETQALPILESLSAPATLFMVGDPAASRAALANDIPLMDAAAQERLAAHPLVTLGYHSRSHANLATLSDSKITLEVAPPAPYAFFAYPGGNHGAKAVNAVERAGYRAAFGIGSNLVTPQSERFILPRTVITQGMNLAQVRFVVSRAVYWYGGLKRNLHA